MEKALEALNSSNITSNSPHLPSLTPRLNPHIFKRKHHYRPSLSPINNVVSKKALKFTSSEKSPSPAMDISKSMPTMKGLDREQLRQLLINERTKAQQSLHTNPYQRDISHLRDKKEIVAIQRIVDFKETFIEPPKASQYLPTNPDHLKSLVQNSDSLGIPRVMSSAGTPNIVCCKRERCLQIVENKTKGKKNFKSAYEDFVTKSKLEADSKLSVITTFHDKILTPISPGLKELEDDFVFLGAPTGRQEVDNLKQWFELMKVKYLEKSVEELKTIQGTEQLDSRMELSNIIFQAGLRDLVRQVSVHCIDRGELLREMLNRYYELWSIFSLRCREELDNEMRTRAQDVDELQKQLSQEVNKRKKKVTDLRRSVVFLKEELEEKSYSYEQLSNRYEELKAKHASNVQDLMKKQKDDVKKMVHRNSLYRLLCTR